MFSQDQTKTLARESELSETQPVYITLRVIDTTGFSSYGNKVNSWDPRIYLSYDDFVDKETRFQYIVEQANRVSGNMFIHCNKGDAKVLSVEPGYTAFTDFTPGTYVVMIRLPKSLYQQLNPSRHIDNAYQLPNGYQITEEQVVGAWLLRRLNEYKAIMFSAPPIRALDLDEMGIWEDPNQAGQWWYQCGPTDQPHPLDCHEVAIEDCEDANESARIAKNRLAREKSRALRYQGESHIGRENAGNTGAELENALLQMAAGNGYLPSDLGIHYHFPMYIAPSTGTQLEQDYENLETRMNALRHGIFKIKTKDNLLAMADLLCETRLLCAAYDEYRFSRCARELDTLFEQFLNANSHFCKDYAFFKDFANLAFAIDPNFSLLKMAETEISDPVQITYLRFAIAQAGEFHQFSKMYDQLCQWPADYSHESLEAFDTAGQIKNAFAGATSLEDLADRIALFLKQRWDRILNTDLEYTRQPANDSLTQICLALARIVQHLKGDKSVYEYLMPTLENVYDTVADQYLSELKLNQFVMDVSGRHGYNLEMLYNHHTFARGDESAMQAALLDPYALPDFSMEEVEEVEAVYIPDIIWYNMIHHSRETLAYHKAFEAWLNAKTQKSDHPLIGPELQKLAEGLRKGSVKGTGSEYNAGPEALEAIQAFHAFFTGLDEASQSFILKLSTGMNSKYINGKYELETFGHLWDILTQKDTQSLSCVQIISGKISMILSQQRYYSSLFDDTFLTASKHFDDATREYKKAYDQNRFNMNKANLPYAPHDVFELIKKHYKLMPYPFLITALGSINVLPTTTYPSHALIKHLIDTISSNHHADLLKAIEVYELTENHQIHEPDIDEVIKCTNSAGKPVFAGTRSFIGALSSSLLTGHLPEPVEGRITVALVVLDKNGLHVSFCDRDEAVALATSLNNKMGFHIQCTQLNQPLQTDYGTYYATMTIADPFEIQQFIEKICHGNREDTIDLYKVCHQPPPDFLVNFDDFRKVLLEESRRREEEEKSNTSLYGSTLMSIWKQSQKWASKFTYEDKIQAINKMLYILNHMENHVSVEIALQNARIAPRDFEILRDSNSGKAIAAFMPFVDWLEQQVKTCELTSHHGL